jgi:uncharacterized membrane protein YdbT with pleckstrin-like domain
MNPQDTSSNPQQSTPPVPPPPASPIPLETAQEEYGQPVAYDAEGRPLYAHPPVQAAPQPQIVQMVRPLEPAKQEMSPEVKNKHDDSVLQYPSLNLSEGEYIIRAVRRHPIGLFIPMILGTFIIAGILSIWLNFATIADEMNLTGPSADPASLTAPVLLFCALIAILMYIYYYIYTNNKFFLTSESVIQEIQNSLFSRNEQTVSLGNIEDASFVQSNILQHLLNYGSIRLSTEGDETTYRFTYVANPKDHIATLNNAVEAFKLGRPVDSSDN